MKKFLFVFVLLLATYFANAQCSACTAAVTPTCPPTGGLCAKLDTAYANQPYSKVIPFYMPKFLSPSQVNISCGGCSSIKLRRIDITGVSGLPGGFGTPYYSQNGSYNVEGGDSVGCATFCGTPLVPGMYVITVYLLADVTAIGTPVGNVDANDQPQQYTDTLWVLPDTTVGVSSFTYGNNGFSSCNTITIDLKANKQAPAPNMTRWFWNIGGTPSQVKEPGLITFNNISGNKPDTFPVSLTTVFYNYRIKSVNAQLNSGWYPDVNEASSAQDPEPYLRVIQTGFQSHNCSNTAPSTKNPSYPNINQVIPEGTFTVDMEIWDDDNCGLLPIFASNEDHVGDYDVTMQLGTFSLFDNKNNSTGTVIIDTIPNVTLNDTLWVVVFPTPPLPVIVAAKDTFCSNDSVWITIGSGYNGYSFQWWRDSIFLTGLNDSAFYTTQAGNYKVTVTDLVSGCQNTSQIKTIYTAQGIDPILVIDNGTKLFITPFPTGMKARWYFNGNLITGQDGKFLDYVGNGDYYAEVYNPAYPGCSATADFVTVTGVGIEQVIMNSILDLNIFPNPNNGQFTISFLLEEAQDISIRVMDAIGQVVYENRKENYSGTFKQEIDFTSLSKGVYTVQVESPATRLTKRVVTQ